MDTMQKAVLIAHTFIAVMIIVLVLLQRGKGADAGAAFGSGASGTVFGARGSSNFFSRATAILATVFFASSLTLAYMSSQRADAPDSLLDRAPPVEAPAEEQSQPGATAEPVPDMPDLDPLEPQSEEAQLPVLEETPQPGDPEDEQTP